jgi:hypothetical protein
MEYSEEKYDTSERSSGFPVSFDVGLVLQKASPRPKLLAKFDDLKKLEELGVDTCYEDAYLAKEINDLMNEQDFPSIKIASASRICSLVPQMEIDTANSIISIFIQRSGFNSILLLPSL